MRIRLIMSCLLLAMTAASGSPVVAQERESPPSEEAAPSPDADESREDDATQSEEDRLAEIVGADEQSESGDYGKEEDDDFVPTQEVSADQSVNFPVDI